MSKLDPLFRYIIQQDPLTISEASGILPPSAQHDMAGNITMPCLLRYDSTEWDALDTLEQVGYTIHTVVGNIVSGEIDAANIDALLALPNVEYVEAARGMVPELDISLSEVRGDLVHASVPGFRGAGAIVGIIDSGIDYTHPAFQDANGNSRILAIWDQTLSPIANESSPAAPLTYGVEYSRADINAALRDADPFTIVRHVDTDQHGTHVAGIAAGNGAGFAAPVFMGVAPEADLIIVKNLGRFPGEAMGDSKTTLDAVNYIFSRAAALGQPVVINQSQGDYLGPHDGTSLLEQGIEGFLDTPGRAMVKSAGNAAGAGSHAGGIVPQGGTVAVGFAPRPLSAPSVVQFIDLWYPQVDRLALSVIAPNGAQTPVVLPLEGGGAPPAAFVLSNGNRVTIESSLANRIGKGDNRIFITLDSGNALLIQSGTWQLVLEGTSISDGQFDAWIQRQRPKQKFAFLAPHLDESKTISIPGTAPRIVTVGAYVTKQAGFVLPPVGDVANFSSVGPTRDERLKPEITAPGAMIDSTIPIAPGVGHDLMGGTSMAAPHVTGAIALMLQADPTLTIAQIRQLLSLTARQDAFTGVTPNPTWGDGKLDVKALVDEVLANAGGGALVPVGP